MIGPGSFRPLRQQRFATETELHMREHGAPSGCLRTKIPLWKSAHSYLGRRETLCPNESRAMRPTLLRIRPNAARIVNRGVFFFGPFFTVTLPRRYTFQAQSSYNIVGNDSRWSICLISPSSLSFSVNSAPRGAHTVRRARGGETSASKNVKTSRSRCYHTIYLYVSISFSGILN